MRVFFTAGLFVRVVQVFCAGFFVRVCMGGWGGCRFGQEFVQVCAGFFAADFFPWVFCLGFVACTAFLVRVFCAGLFSVRFVWVHAGLLDVGLGLFVRVVRVFLWQVFLCGLVRVCSCGLCGFFCLDLCGLVWFCLCRLFLHRVFLCGFVRVCAC